MSQVEWKISKWEPCDGLASQPHQSLVDAGHCWITKTKVDHGGSSLKTCEWNWRSLIKIPNHSAIRHWNAYGHPGLPANRVTRIRYAFSALSLITDLRAFGILSNKGKGSLLEEPCRYLGWQPCLLVDWYSHIFTTSGTIGHTSGVLRQSDWHVQEKTSSMGLLLGCAWNGVSMGSMCWAAATISKQCSVLCFVMAVFISQQAWLEKRTRAMQQLHLQNDLTYQVCSQQFKNRKKSVVCYTRSAFGGAFLEDSTRLMCGESASCMLGMSHISGLSQFEWLQLLNAISWHMASVLATKLFGQNWFLKPGL